MSEASDVPSPPGEVGELTPEWQRFLARLMTGYESAHRRLLDGYDVLSQRLQVSEGVAARALETQLKMTQEYEHLLSLRHERELAGELARRRAESMSAITRDMRALLPIAAKQLLGVPVASADGHGLQNLLASLEPEQLESVMTTGRLELSVAQRQALAMVLGSLAEKEEGGSGGEKT